MNETIANYIGELKRQRNAWKKRFYDVRASRDLWRQRARDAEAMSAPLRQRNTRLMVRVSQLEHDLASVESA